MSRVFALNSRSKKKSQEIVAAIYQYLLKHGPTRSDVLSDGVDCAVHTVRCDQQGVFNLIMRDLGHPHLLRAEREKPQGRGSAAVIWSLRER